MQGLSGRPKKTWLEVIKNDMKGLCLASVDALDHHAMDEEGCGGHELTQVCLELPWDSSQDEWAVKWCAWLIILQMLFQCTILWPVFFKH